MAGSTTKLQAILREIAESNGFECVGVDLSNSPAGKIVRIYIDSPDGVMHGNCETVSRAVTEYMDRCDEEGAPWFSGKYFVEVSSPGLERPLFTLEHYARFAGRDALVLTKDRKKIAGRIVSSENGVVVLETDAGETHAIPFEEIKRGHLVYIPQKGTKNKGKQASSEKGKEKSKRKSKE